MTDKTNPDWLQLQQQYWNAYLAMLQNPGSSADDKQADSSPWVDALDAYWETLSPLTTPEAREMLNKFILQSQQYLHFATASLKLFQQPQTEFKQVLEDLMGTKTYAHLNFWETPLENWQQVVNDLAPFPLAAYLLAQPATQNLHKQHWLSMLGINQANELQQELHEVMRLWVLYQQAHQAYQNILSKVGGRSMELLQTKFDELQQQGVKFDNLRQLYDLWIDCGEIAYSEIVRSEEYADISASMANALMAWKQRERHLADKILEAARIPTRKELDSLHQRTQELRREIRILKAKQCEEQIINLKQELKHLRAELEILKPSPAKTTKRRSVKPKPKTGE